MQVDAENFTMVMSALESVQISLMIMTGAGMAKQIYKEEVHQSVLLSCVSSI
jgi:hypothetical protein